MCKFRQLAKTSQFHSHRRLIFSIYTLIGPILVYLTEKKIRDHEFFLAKNCVVSGGMTHTKPSFEFFFTPAIESTLKSPNYSVWFHDQITFK